MATATLAPIRKTRTARPMTPVRITARYRSLSTGHYETWAAVSADGAWSFERLDMPRTPWRLTHDDGEGWCTGCGVSMFDGSYDVEADECREKRDLAAIWADNPDYQEGWKP